MSSKATRIADLEERLDEKNWLNYDSDIHTVTGHQRSTLIHGGGGGEGLKVCRGMNYLLIDIYSIKRDGESQSCGGQCCYK